MTEKGKNLRAIDKPVYRYWQALYRSFFDSRLYVDVAKRWKGFGFIYLFLLIALLSLPFSLRVLAEFNTFFNKEIVQPMLGLPTLYMQNGKVSINQPMPYIVKNSSGQAVAIVDTTGKISTLDGTYPNLNILVTQDKLFLRYPMPKFFFNTTTPEATSNDVQIYPFSQEGNSVFEGKEWVKKSGVLNLKIFFGVLLFPTIIFVATSVFAVFMLVFALMGQFIAQLFFKTSLSYKQACRLLIVSMTPFQWIFWLVMTLALFYSSYSLILPLLMASYFCYAVLAVKRDSQKLVHS
ncbi:MAG: DUF1189 family protein [Tatlockia sp.]|nr:DUF1189 family protein [Tatlockia sp.]